MNLSIKKAMRSYFAGKLRLQHVFRTHTESGRLRDIENGHTVHRAVHPNAYRKLDVTAIAFSGRHGDHISQQAAGIIHTDFEKGFIRAEVIKYDDYVSLGSESAVRDAGKLGVEGKEYVVQDGDIMHFRFNV